MQYCVIESAPGFAAISWMAVLLLLWLLALLFSQLTMIAAETTSFEAMKNRNENVTKYSIGVMFRNVMRFLRTGEYRITRRAEEEQVEMEALLSDTRLESKSSNRDLTRFRQGSFDMEHQHADGEGRNK